MTKKDTLEGLHILILPSWYLPRGGDFVREQAFALKSMGMRVNILANVELSLTNDKLNYLTYPIRTFVSHEDNLVVYRNFFRCLPKAQKANGDLWIRKTLRMFDKYCKKFGTPDIIHAHSAKYAGYVAALIKEKYSIPYVVTEHLARFSLSCEYAQNMFADWHTPYYEKAFSDANFIIPVSVNIQPKIESFLVRRTAIKAISNMLDCNYFHFKKRNVSDKIRFVATNSFFYYKGYDILFPAFDKACNKNKNIEISIVGGNFNTSEFQKIWSKVENKDKFHFVGKLDREGVRNELWKANIFILPSRVESQSISTLEALSTGLPVIVTSVVPAFMTTSQNSIVVPVEDVESLTMAILQMSNTYQNYDGKMISEHIKDIVSEEIITKKIMDVYKQVLNK